jgi:hypothetical protein
MRLHMQVSVGSDLHANVQVRRLTENVPHPGRSMSSPGALHSLPSTVQVPYCRYSCSDTAHGVGRGLRFMSFHLAFVGLCAD